MKSFLFYTSAALGLLKYSQHTSTTFTDLSNSPHFVTSFKVS